MKFKTYLLVVISAFLFSASSVFAFQATFLPRISLEEEYSDNIFLAGDNEEDELITVISLGFDTGLLWQNAGIDLSYDPAAVLYHEFSENDTWRHNALLYGWTDITQKTRLEVRDAFLRTEDPLGDEEIYHLRSEDPAILPDPTLRTTREPYWTNIASVRVTNRFGASDSFYLEYAYEILENEDKTLEDNTRHLPSAGLTYWFGPKWGFELTGTYTKAEYDREDEFYTGPDAGDISDDFEEGRGIIRLNRRFTRQFQGFLAYTHTYVDFEKTEEDYQIYNPSIGFDYSVPPNTSILVDIGYFVQDNSKRAGNIDDESGITANIDLTKTLRRGSITLEGSGGHDEAYFGAESLGISLFYEAGLAVEYNITRRVLGDIFVSFRQDKYVDEVPTRRDKNTQGGVGLSYTYERWLSTNINFILTTEYSYNKLNSSIDTNDYVENRGLFRITLTRSQQYRSGN